jgi:hypothetical protein
MANPLHSQIWKKQILTTVERREKKGWKSPDLDQSFKKQIRLSSLTCCQILAKDDCPMPTLLPHKLEKENPAQKWGNLVAKSERVVGSNIIIYSDLSRRRRPEPLPRQPSLARTPKFNSMIQSPTSTSLRTAWSIVDIITNLVKTATSAR